MEHSRQASVFYTGSCLAVEYNKAGAEAMSLIIDPHAER